MKAKVGIVAGIATMALSAPAPALAHNERGERGERVRGQFQRTETDPRVPNIVHQLRRQSFRLIALAGVGGGGFGGDDDGGEDDD